MKNPPVPGHPALRLVFGKVLLASLKHVLMVTMITMMMMMMMTMMMMRMLFMTMMMMAMVLIPYPSLQYQAAGSKSTGRNHSLRIILIILIDWS